MLGRSASAMPSRIPPSMRVGVVGDLAELDDVPAVAREALRDVVAVRELGRAVDGDVVVVVDVDEAAEAEVPGERRRLVAHALLEAAVAADHEHVVVDDVGTEALAEVALGEADAHAVAEPCPSGPVVTSTPGRVPVLGVAGVRDPHWRN